MDKPSQSKCAGQAEWPELEIRYDSDDERQCVRLRARGEAQAVDSK